MSHFTLIVFDANFGREMRFQDVENVPRQLRGVHDAAVAVPAPLLEHLPAAPNVYQGGGET